jgi:hypothetical protein
MHSNLFLLLSFISIVSSSVDGHLDVVTDPDGTSLRQTETKADDVSRSVSPIKHGTTRVLAHEVARQLLAERRIAKLKAHLEQAEVFSSFCSKFNLINLFTPINTDSSLGKGYSKASPQGSRA